MQLVLKNITWLLPILTYVVLANQCSRDMEPTLRKGFDIQFFNSQDDYRSLYVFDNTNEYVIVSGGDRKTGKISTSDHTKLFGVLSQDNKNTLRQHSVLGSDAVNHPYISIKERSDGGILNNSEFFVLVETNSENPVIKEVIEMVDYIFSKYQQ